jgi:hypothetical protein
MTNGSQPSRVFGRNCFFQSITPVEAMVSAEHQDQRRASILAVARPLHLVVGQHARFPGRDVDTRCDDSHVAVSSRPLVQSFRRRRAPWRGGCFLRLQPP